MKKILVIIGFISACNYVYALDFKPYEGPEPIAVIIQTNPWLMVVGSDMPRMVLYANGQIIYLKKTESDKPAYYSKFLDPRKLTEIKEKLSSIGDYSKLKHYYDLAPGVSDQSETKLYLSFDDVECTVGVYDLETNDTDFPAYDNIGSNQESDTLPEEIRKLHAYLTSFDYADAEPWEPIYIEVMIWNYDYAPDEAIHWPSDWPGLKSPYTIKRGDSYSIYLPATELRKLRDFLRSRRQKGAVEIDGMKWAVSVRYVFPSEPTWIEAFQKIYLSEEKPDSIIGKD